MPQSPASVTVGILIRAERQSLSQVENHLEALPGVATFPLEEPGTFGAVLQAADLDAAHRRLKEEIETTPGVLCAWPVDTRLGPGAPNDT